MLQIIKNKYFLLISVTLIILIVIGFSAREQSGINSVNNVVNVVLSPLQNFFSFSGQKVEGSLAFLTDRRNMKQENETLRAKVAELEKENRELLEYKEKNKELRDVLNLKDQFNEYDFIGANIIAKDSSNWFNVFTIDRGTKDGITNNYPVLTGNGLVGRVSVSSFISSRVVSIIDVDSAVSCRISKTRDLVIVKGDLSLKDRGLCRMDYIPTDVDVVVGDTIETSGLGGIFPKGIVVGKVKEIRQINNEMNRYAIVEPSIDFKRLEEVFVLKSKSQH